MRGKLIIHIGPPKTATTSLQYWLQNNTIKDSKYIGINQPRALATLGSRLYSICCKENNNQSETSLIQKELSKELEINKYVLFSEELFVVEQTEISYKDKLTRLFNLIKEFDHRIIFCIRNPENSIPAFYQEIYNSLPKLYKNSFKLFEHSAYSKCYHYENLTNLLKQIGFNEISWFLFSDFVQGKLTLGEVLSEPELNSYISPIKLNKSNIKGGQRITYRTGYIEYAYSHLIKLIPSFFFRKRGYGKTIQNIIKNHDIKSKRNLGELVITKKTKNIYKKDLKGLLFVD